MPDYARKIDGAWVLVSGAFTVRDGGKSIGPADPNLPNGPKRATTYDLKFPHNWLELSTAEDRGQWGIKAIAPADSPPEGALVLATEIFDHQGAPKYRCVLAPQAD
jgi:hypothetical protein